MKLSKNSIKEILSPAFIFLAICSIACPSFAGDVLVEISRNNITLTGSTQDDGMCIFEGSNGNIMIEAFGRTTLNGSSSLDTGVDLSDANNISFDMRGGDDCIEINFIDNPLPQGILGNLSLRMGPGNDSVRLELGDVGGNVDIVMNGGDDFLVFRSSTIAGDVNYLSGAGSDVGFIGRDFQSEPVVVLGDFTSRCAGGNDMTFYTTGTVIGDLDHSSGGGSDQFFFEDFVAMNDVNYSGGGGQDTGTFGGGGSFMGGPTASQIDGDLVIRGGGGNDILNFGVNQTALCSGAIDYSGGAGRDTVNTGDNAIFEGAISVSLGQGNDTLNYSVLAEFTIPGVLNGGAGIDTIQPSETDLELLGFTVTGFED